MCQGWRGADRNPWLAKMLKPGVNSGAPEGYAVPISIENLLFGSDNLTDENNLIVFRNVQKCIHHANRFWCQI